MTTEEKFKWLCERFRSDNLEEDITFFGIINYSRKKNIIDEKEELILNKLYNTCPGLCLDSRNVQYNYKWESKTILAVELLYKAVRKYDNKG